MTHPPTNLEGLVAGILLHIVQQPEGVAQPEYAGFEVFAALYHPLHRVEVARQQRAHLVVVVDAVRVSNAHEEDVGRQPGQQRYRYLGIQF